MKAKTREPIQSDISLQNTSILGEFDGECADADVYNENALRIGREVWTELFASEDYQKGLRLGHYIGFLGHPEDPGCQDFKQACIVMTFCELLENGKLHGRFNLVDTPVGRVVKAFIDAGVQFGISVRGAGDIVSDDVVPGTFVFRGFDLVTFPAYPDAIPTYSDIAASTDTRRKARYAVMCNAINKNLKDINDRNTLTQLKVPFNASDDIYKSIEARDSEIKTTNSAPDFGFVCDESDILSDKLEAMTELFMAKSIECEQLQNQLTAATQANRVAQVKSDRKISSIRRIMGQQVQRITASYDALKASSEKERTSFKQQISDMQVQRADDQRIIKDLKQTIRASRDTQDTYEHRIGELEEDNLKYRQKVEASRNKIADQAETISGLQQDLDETVAQVKAANAGASNRDGRVRELIARITAAEELICQYQDAYAALYASAVGATLENISATTSTTVDELRGAINGDIKLMPSNVFTEPQPMEVDNEDDDDDNGSDLVTC